MAAETQYNQSSCSEQTDSAKITKKRKKNALSVTNPELAAQWHPTKNGELTPDDVAAGSDTKAWWLLPYDDPKTGKHFDFEWPAYINNRVRGNGCPYLTGRAAWRGFNDLATTHPDLAAQWHPTKNGDLTPYDVTAGSTKKVWWFLPYDDPKTGRHFDFEWPACISKRIRGDGCPYLSGKAVWRGFNDLTTTHPDLAAQWHPTKNGGLTPYDVTAGSRTDVWWFLPYDDPKTGKHFDFEWRTKIPNRTNGDGCPYLSGRAVWRGFNDLATTHPDLAKEWHPTKNGNLTPYDVVAGSRPKVWWFLPYSDPKTGKHFEFEWEAYISNRANGKDCPYLAGQAVWRGFNDLATTHPDIAAQWHPTKNGNLTPYDVIAGSHTKVWWFLPYDDPRTGKHFEFEWAAEIRGRTTHGSNCPYLSGKAVWRGFNDLATTHPDLAAQWHPTKNRNFTPDDVTAGSEKKVWWFLPYDDPRTGKHFDFEWPTKICERTHGSDCPYLSGRAVWRGFNDLATTHPDLAKEWHPTKNGGLTPYDVMTGSSKTVWWFLPYDDPKTGKHFDFEWPAYISNRTRGVGCPYLSEPNGEQYVRKYLSNNNITSERQKTFNGLYGVGSGKLSYDFAIPGYNILIEYHGRQHYKPIEYFGGEKQFKVQKEHDRRKRKYAKENGYTLIEISYKYDTYEKVAAYLEEHLLPLLRQIAA